MIYLKSFSEKYSNFRVIDANIPFNYSKINNLAAHVELMVKILVLLNNDTEIIQEGWLDIMIGYTTQSHIGAVGPKLLYPDLTFNMVVFLDWSRWVASHAYIGEDRTFAKSMDVLEYHIIMLQ